MNNKITVVDLDDKEHIVTISGDIEPVSDLLPELLPALKIKSNHDLFTLEKIHNNFYKLIKKAEEIQENDTLLYDIVISFAGEDREVAKNIAVKIQEKNLSVFYDSYEKSSLWGKDLYTYLSTIYKDKAKFCIILISESYRRKLWTKHELKSAQARAFSENREYILPIRLDSTEIKGILPTTGYISYPDESCEEIAILLERKLAEL